MKVFKDFLTLPVSMLLAETVFVILLVGLGGFIADKYLYFILALVSMIAYYVIADKIIVKVESRPLLKKSMIFTAVCTVISCLAVIFAEKFFGSDILFFHIAVVSPVACEIMNLLCSVKNVSALLSVGYHYELFITILSPISILIIFAFHKISLKKKM